MSLEKLVSDVKHNCEITNARFFSGKDNLISDVNLKELYRHEHKDMKPYQNLPSSILRGKPGYYAGELFSDFKKRKKDFWHRIRNKPYNKIPLPEFKLEKSGIVYNEWERPDRTSYILGRKGGHFRLNGAGSDCDIIHVDEILASDVDFCITRAFYYSDKHGDRILINNHYSEHELWTDITTADEPPAEFVFEKILADAEAENFEKVISSRNYKGLLEKKSVLTECHETGHWMAKEKYGYLKIKNEEQKSADEMLADTISGGYLSTLNYILQNDDPGYPVLFNMYHVNSQGFEFEFAPELNDVWTRFPDKTSTKNLEKAIETISKRALRKLKL